jgi:DNA mismatch endonuclease (patch repair protein)
VRKMLHALGYRFRLHRRDLPGTPDLVFPGRRAVIQVHGCFWHQHEGCRLASVPRTRKEYWQVKLRRNRERDQQAEERLALLGWRVMTVWECELEHSSLLLDRLLSFLGPRKAPSSAKAITER